MPAKIDKIEFLIRARATHGDKYDYSKLDYHKINQKGIIICKVHGEFEQSLIVHTHAAHGCPKCGGSVKKNLQTFEESSRLIHGDKYDYSKFIYVNNKTKSTLICRTCKVEFDVRPDAHMNGKGCRECGYRLAALKRSKPLNVFVEQACSVHGDKYDYSRSVYINNSTKVDIICIKHGSFDQEPSNHLRGSGCPLCMNSSGEDLISSTLNELNIDFLSEHRFADCFHKSVLLFDFYLPDRRMCIEYDGQQHFKAVDFFGGDEVLLGTRHRDLIKTRYCLNNNIFLLRITYLEKDLIPFILKTVLI